MGAPTCRTFELLTLLYLLLSWFPLAFFVYRVGLGFFLGGGFFAFLCIIYLVLFLMDGGWSRRMYRGTGGDAIYFSLLFIILAAERKGGAFFFFCFLF